MDAVSHMVFFELVVIGYYTGSNLIQLYSLLRILS